MCGLHSQSYHTYCVTEGCCLLLLLLSLFMLLSLLLLLSACCWLAITCTVYLQHSVLSPAAKTVQVEPYHPYMRPGTLITAPCHTILSIISGWLRELEDLHLQRLRVDIKDFQPAEVEGLSKNWKPWVAAGKHLCGAATNCTLRWCASSMQHSRSYRQQSPQQEPSVSQISQPGKSILSQQHTRQQP